MRKMRKGAVMSIAMAGSLSLLAGCGVAGNAHTAAAASAPVNGGTLTIAQSIKYNDKFIPLLDASTYTFNVNGMAFDSLLNVDKNLKYIQGLAKSWSWSADKKSLTMQLQPNAKWSDGQPITSDDVLFTMDYLASKTYNTTLGGQYESSVDPVVGSNLIMTGKKTSFAQTGGFTKINSKTFRITFKQVDAAVLWSDIAGLQPIPKHVLGKVPMKDWITDKYDRSPSVVSGPFKFVAVHGQDSVEMAANPLYWRGRPHIDKIVFKTVNDNVQPGEMAKGDIDLSLVGIKPSDVSKLRAEPNITVVTTPGMNYDYLGFKVQQPEFKDVRVRQAFMYALNRDEMIKGIWKGLAQKINGPVPSVSWAAATNANGLNPYNYSQSKANALLDAAGWTKGKDGFRIDPTTGKTASINLDYTNDPTVTQEAIAVTQDLANVGVKVNSSHGSDFNVLVQKVEHDDKSLQLWIMGWGLSADPDPRGIWGSKNTMNFPRWTDPKDDQLIAKTFNAAAFNTAVRKKAIIDWQVLVNQQLPYAFLWQEDNLFAYNNRLHIPAQDNTPLGLLNPQDWWLK